MSPSKKPYFTEAHACPIYQPEFNHYCLGLLTPSKGHRIDALGASRLATVTSR